MLKIFRNSALKSLGQEAKLPAALSIAFYNNTKVLDLTLAGVSRQTLKNFELIICDDGSKPEAVEHVQKALESLDIPAMHLWHEDIGFRKNRMLNWGIHHCHSDYMIFIDQDCIPHPQFVREHSENRRSHSVLCGRRMDFTPWVSRMLTPEKIRAGFIENNLWWMIPAGFYMKDNNGGKGIYFQNPFFRKLANKKHRGIVGCNFSVHRQDLLDINGFDWRYEGAGTGEDSDIEYRMKLLGVQMLPFCNTAVQYHVFHKLLKRPSLNESIFAEVQAEKKAVTDHGLRQQLEESSQSIVI
ncbi:MAG: glycosyltransferase [Pseudobdellovibrionaceae bacterium]